MNFMCLADFEQVLIVGFEGFKTVVYKPIVKNKVDNAVGANASAYPKAVIERQVPQPHQA